MNVGEIDLSLVLTSKDFETQLNNTVNKTVNKVQKDVNKGVDNTVKQTTGKIRNAFDPLQNELNNTVKSATNQLNNEVSGTFLDMGNELTQTVNGAVNDIEKEFNGIDLNFDNINYSTLTQGLSEVTGEIKNSFAELEGDASKLESSFNDLGADFRKSFDDVPLTVNEAGNSFEELSSDAAKLGRVIDNLGDNFDQVGDRLEDNLGEVSDTIDRGSEEIKTSGKRLKDAFNGIGDGLENSTEGLRDAIKDADNEVGGLSNSLEGIGNSTQEGANISGEALEGLGGKAKRIAGIIGTAFAFDQLKDAVLDWAELGSDLDEVGNVVDTVFTSMNNKVREFSQNAISQFGMSETMTMNYVGTLGSMARAFNFTEAEAYEMATTLSGLAGDVASFYNIDHEEAFTKLKSVFTGETEALKDLGIVMTQTALDEYALAHGFGKTTSEMTEQEKTALRYKFVLDKLKFAQGDFAKTSDGWANQMRVFQLQWESLKGTLGRGFVIILTPILTMLNKIIARIIEMANLFVQAISNIKKSLGGLGGATVGKIKTTASKAVPKLANGGYFKKNKPQLAIIGDNTHEGEIVAPESKISNAVSEGIKKVVSKPTSKENEVATKQNELKKVISSENEKVLSKINDNKDKEVKTGEKVINNNEKVIENNTIEKTVPVESKIVENNNTIEKVVPIRDNESRLEGVVNNNEGNISNEGANSLESDITLNNINVVKTTNNEVENKLNNDKITDKAVTTINDEISKQLNAKMSDKVMSKELTNSMSLEKVNEENDKVKPITIDKNTNAVPKLAKGGYVKKNKPQLVMIGDNMREGEIVSPESKIINAVSEGIKKVVSNDKSKTVNVKVDAPKTTTSSKTTSSQSSSSKSTMNFDEVNKLGDESKEVTNNTSKISKTVKTIGNTAKKIINDSKKALMGFDELNVLSLDEEENNLDSVTDPLKDLDDLTSSIPDISDSLGGDKLKGLEDNLKGIDSDLKGLGDTGIGDLVSGLEDATLGAGELAQGLDEANEELSTADKMAGALKDRLGELAGLFKQGFDLGLGTPNFDNITEHARGIMASCRAIFTDPMLQKAVDDFWNSLVYNVGQILGSLASIGLTAVELLIGGIDLYLAENKGFIRDFFVSEFEALADIFDIIGSTFRDVADIFTVFRSDEAKSILAGLIEIFANTFMGIIELATKFGRDVLNAITQPFRDNKDKIKDLLMGLLKTIEPIIQGIADFVTHAMEKINDVYDKHLKPLVDSIGSLLSGLLGTILDNINNFLMPLLELVGGEVKKVFDNYISPVFDQVMDIIGQVADILSVLIEYGLKPMLQFIVDAFAPAIGVAIGGAFVIVVEAVKVVMDVISDFLKIIEGLLDFVLGAFTNDWDLAWEGLSYAVSSAFGLIDNLTGGLLSSLADFVGSIGQWFVDAYNSIQRAFDGAGEWADGVGKSIEAGFNNCMANVGQWFSQKYEDMKKAFNGAGEWAKGVGKSMKAGIKTGFTNMGAFMSERWSEMKKSFSGVTSWFSEKFGQARNSIMAQFKGLPSWFNGLWSSIRASFSGLGTRLGNMIGGAIKSAVNYVLALCENKINSFISLFNGIIKYVNKLPGVNVGAMNKVHLPRLAEGGYVRANTPQLAVIGDNKREGEIVAPESKIAEAVAQGVAVAFEKVIGLINNQNDNRASQGDIIIPVSIGQEHIDTIIINSQRRQTLRSGGRV